MIIHDLGRTERPAESQALSATATFETPEPRSFNVYFEWKNAPGEIALTADPFLIGFLTPAMLLGEKLEVQGPVDPQLLSNIREEIIPLLRRWYRSLNEIELICPELQPPSLAKVRATAMAWSGGLDASYTAVKHLGSIDWLITSQGFDARSYHQDFWERVLRDIRSSADHLGKPLMVVKTNLREVSHYQAIQTRRGRIDPDYYLLGHNGPIGNYFAAIGRCGLPFMDRFLLSANVSYEKLYPFGSHPLLDPKWSTAAQQVIHDGCEAGRIEKIAFLKNHRPDTLKHLRVCWIPGPGEVNCGRCEKCLRTMAELRCADGEEAGAAFPVPIDFRAIRRLKLDSHHQFLWEQIRDAARRRGDRDLTRAATAAAHRPLSSYLPETERRRRRNEQRRARDLWKHTRRIMKPPKEDSGEVPTPAGILEAIAERRS